jgi:hypothetical protein
VTIENTCHASADRSLTIMVCYYSRTLLNVRFMHIIKSCILIFQDASMS